VSKAPPPEGGRRYQPVATHNVKGVFCLEGDWEKDLKSKTSMGPVLELLEKSSYPSVPFIRRDVATLTEFDYYLGRWRLKKYDRYPILYLGFHGNPGALRVGYGRRKGVDLAWLEERLEGACKRRIIHFGSCGTLDIHGNRIRSFLERTGALAVCGYKSDVDWMLSAAFEIVLFYELQYNTLTRQGMAAVKRRVEAQASHLARSLEFRMVIAG
jgi:hypothetical protein